jgi:hypothetical protein
MFGLKEAQYVQGKIRQAGIQDVQLFFDPQIKMWAVCQVMKHGGILLPEKYLQDGIKPHIMFYIKDNEGRARLPSEQDISDIVVIATRAQTSFKKGGDWLADRFDDQSAEKDRKHQEKFKQKIHTIAPAMKKALKSGNL